VELPRQKSRNKSDGEHTYPMTQRVPLVDLASWQEEGGDHHGAVWGLPPTRGEKNKQWSESVFGVMPYRAEPGTRSCLTDGSGMSEFRDLRIFHRSRAAHNIHPHPYFLTLKFHRCVSHVPSY
jgi:hypothetical protein